MNNLIYTIALVFIIIWAIGYLGYNIGGLLHILLVLAIFAILMRVIQGKKPIE